MTNTLKNKEILKQSFIDPASEVKFPPVALSKGTYGFHNYPLRIATYGNFSFIHSHAKSGKTFFTSLLAAVYLSDGCVNGDNLMGHRNGRKLIHYDTEQGDFDAHIVFKRVVDLADKSDDYFTYALREYSPRERLDFIDWHLSVEENVGLVILDGVADLVNDINDINQANYVVGRLMKWTKEHNIHIITVIHSNYGSDKPTGHLGSSLEKKCETQIQLNREEDSSNVLVKCKRSRGQAFEDFQFTINKQGFPEVMEDIPNRIDGEKYTRV
jgi:hypothetical protein